MALVDDLQVARARGIVEGLRPGLAFQRLTELEPSLAKYVKDRIDAHQRLIPDGAISDSAMLSLIRSQQALAVVCIEAVKLAIHHRLQGTDAAAIIESADPAIADPDILADYLAAHRKRTQGQSNQQRTES